MVNCIIGPISFSNGFSLEKSNDYGIMDGKEKFSIVGDLWKLKQLKGLITRGKSETSNDITIRGSNSKDWGPIWVNATDILPDNTDLNHKGWYLLRELDIDKINSTVGRATLTLELITNVYKTLLEMDYTPGTNAGTLRDVNFNVSENWTLFEETFSGTSLDTNEWVASNWMMNSPNVAVSGGKLLLSGVSGPTIPAGYPHWASNAIQSKRTFDAPFFVEFDLEVDAVETTPNYDGFNIHFTLTPGYYKLDENWNNTFLVINDSGNGMTDRRIVRPGTDPLKRTTYSSSHPLIQYWKMYFDENGVVTLWTRNNTSSDWEFYWKGPAGIDNINGIRIGVCTHSHCAVNHTVKTSNIKVYKTGSVNPGYTVTSPNLSSIQPTPDYIVGSVAKYKNPTQPIVMSGDTDNLLNIYGGSPTVTTSNGIVYDKDEILSPGNCTIQNGTIALEVLSDGVNLKNLIGSTYTTLRKFSFGTIEYLRLKRLTPEEIILQINRTEWKMRRGSDQIDIIHPYNDLTFTRFRMAYADSNLIGLTDATQIPMNSGPYALLFSPFNLLTQTQSDCTAIDGYTASGATIAVDSEGNSGTGIKVTLTTVANTGIMQNPLTGTPLLDQDNAGLKIQYSAYLKSNDTTKPYVNLIIVERDSAGGGLVTYVSPSYQLTSTYTRYVFNTTITNSNTRSVSCKVLSKNATGGTFLYDNAQIAPNVNTGILSTYYPSALSRYGLQVFSENPRTLLGNTILANDLTSIGVLDQLQSPNLNLGHYSKLLEWMNPVDQRIRITSGL